MKSTPISKNPLLPSTINNHHSSFPLPLLFIITLLACLTSLSLHAEDHEPVIEEAKPMEEKGVYRSLENGDWVNVRIVDNLVYAYILNSDRTLKKGEAESILLDVDELGTYGKNARWRSVLKPTSPLEYSAPRKIYPPYDFFFTLIIRLPNDEVESITRIKYIDDSTQI